MFIVNKYGHIAKVVNEDVCVELNVPLNDTFICLTEKSARKLSGNNDSEIELIEYEQDLIDWVY